MVVKSIYEVKQIIVCGKMCYGIFKANDEHAAFMRYYTTRGQAFLALGIIEALISANKKFDNYLVDFLTKAASRLINGNDWLDSE